MKHAKLLPLLILLPLSAIGQRQPARTGVANSCTQSSLLARLAKGPGAAVLRSYGYDLREPWACTSIQSPWLAGSVMLRFQKVSAETDDKTAFSVLKVSGVDYIWVVPTGTGMLEVPRAESDPHNIAAFNALLQSVRKSPSSPSGWRRLGKLYLTMLGHKEAAPISPETGSTSVCNREGECTVAFSDRPVRPGEAFNKWTLVFSGASGGKSAVLEEASRETVSNPSASAERGSAAR